MINSESTSRSSTPAQPRTAPAGFGPSQPLRLHDDKEAQASNMSTCTSLPGTLEKATTRGMLQQLWLRWFTAYRCLIAVSIAINICIVVPLAVDGLPLADVLTGTAVNLFVSVLLRNEEVVNSSFGLITMIPPGSPLWLRKTLADFHHYGGMHIGCAISATLWYIVFVVLNAVDCMRKIRNDLMLALHWADIVTCGVFLLFLMVVCVTAMSRLRAKFHDWFECAHRFGGWAALAVLWANTIIRAMTNTGSTVYMNPAIWLLTATTFLIILPWTRICTVPIISETVSGREIKLSFPYADMPYTSTMRFSLRPLTEWHAFATIPSANGFTATILIAGLGNWTRKVVDNPPKRIYIRRSPALNFLAWTPIFNSVLLVGTGAGIGPLLSLMASPAMQRMRAQGKKVKVMWIAYAPEMEHWGFVRDTIASVDHAPKIFDSRAGRPDIPFEVRSFAQDEDVEAVMVVSNREVTDGVVREVKRSGGAAYGAVFDS